MQLFLLFAGASVIGAALLIWKTSIRVYEETSSEVPLHMSSIPPEALGRLDDRRVFFGHHSVGGNIIDGVCDLMATSESLGFRIVKTKNPVEIKSGTLAHAAVGKNCDPISKIREFEELMRNGLADQLDIALFKLCFVDIGITSQPKRIIAVYCEAMEQLKLLYPNVVFVHVTVPLCGPAGTTKGVMKAAARRVLGRPPVLADNQVRARYNTLLRQRFCGKEPVFDLALYETLGSDGTRYYGMRNDEEIPILARMYTDDGGHLNAVGRRHIAEQLLIKLLEVAREEE